MTQSFLVKLFEHNNWANLQIIQACYALTDEQRSAEPLVLEIIHDKKGIMKCL